MAPLPDDNGDSSREYASIPVSHEFRTKLRVAKAEDGLSYEDYLRRHVPVEAEG